MNPINPPFRAKNAATPFRWFPVKNTAGSDAPPSSLMLITGMDSDGRLTVTRPTANNMDPRRIVISKGVTIKAGQYGQATMDVPWWVANGDGGSVAAISAGDEGGTVASSWVMGAGTGYFVLAADGPTSTALVMSGGGGGSGAVELIKINPPTFYLGTGGVTLCFYDGTIINPTIAAGWSNLTTNVWWVSRYADAIVDPLPGQTNMTVVTVDGTKAYPGKYYGESYDPVNSLGAHQGSRKVYWWPGFAAGIDEACDSTGGVPVAVLDVEG